MTPGKRKMNIVRATAWKKPAKMPAGSIPNLPKAKPAKPPPPRSGGPANTAANASAKDAERPCFVSSSQWRALSSSARRISAVGDTLPLHEPTDARPVLKATGELQEELLEARLAAAGARAQLLQGPHRDHPAAVHDRHPVAEGLGDLQDVGREDHGATVSGELLEQVLDPAGGAWVEPV